MSNREERGNRVGTEQKGEWLTNSFDAFPVSGYKGRYVGRVTRTLLDISWRKRGNFEENERDAFECFYESGTLRVSRDLQCVTWIKIDRGVLYKRDIRACKVLGNLKQKNEKDEIRNLQEFCLRVVEYSVAICYNFTFRRQFCSQLSAVMIIINLFNCR